MAKVRLKNPKMASFSSHLGTVKFLNGISEDHVSEAEQRLLGAITSVEIVEDDGATRDGGDAAKYTAGRKTGAPVIQPPKTGDRKTYKAEENPAPVESRAPRPDPEDVEAAALEAEIEAQDAAEDAAPEAAPADDAATAHSRAELEAIADEEGIRGLRAISAPMGIKDTSIDGLIKGILTHQKKAG